SKLVLDKVLEVLLPHKGLKLEVAGHTDASGSAASNLKLSQARAEAVLRYLTDKGVDSELFSAKGYGEVDPVADNTTVEGRAQNRRVELNRLKE
ncbi:MAG: OmpA family protein, partial [Proteobacteria bacterium]|nr:OmpA family protein [Pseudomonadota bacterium]